MATWKNSSSTSKWTATIRNHQLLWCLPEYITTQVWHVKTGSCMGELRLIGIPTKLCRWITRAVRDLPVHSWSEVPNPWANHTNGLPYARRWYKPLQWASIPANGTGFKLPFNFYGTGLVGYRKSGSPDVHACGHVISSREPMAEQCFVTCPRRESYMNAIHQLVPWISCG